MSDPSDGGQMDEDREISDVGLPHAGDDVRADETGRADADETALDEVFPAEKGRR